MCDTSVTYGNNLGLLCKDVNDLTSGIIGRSITKIEKSYNYLFGNNNQKFTTQSDQNEEYKMDKSEMESLPPFLNQLSVFFGILDSTFDLTNPLASLHKIVSSKIQTTKNENEELLKKIEILKVIFIYFIFYFLFYIFYFLFFIFIFYFILFLFFIFYFLFSFFIFYCLKKVESELILAEKKNMEIFYNFSNKISKNNYF